MTSAENLEIPRTRQLGALRSLEFTESSQQRLKFEKRQHRNCSDFALQHLFIGTHLHRQPLTLADFIYINNHLPFQVAGHNGSWIKMVGTFQWYYYNLSNRCGWRGLHGMVAFHHVPDSSTFMACKFTQYVAYWEVCTTYLNVVMQDGSGITRWHLVWLCVFASSAFGWLPPYLWCLSGWSLQPAWSTWFLANHDLSPSISQQRMLFPLYFLWNTAYALRSCSVLEISRQGTTWS